MKLKLLVLALLVSGLGWSQVFTATYDFGSVTTSSGTNDPTPVPVAANITFGSFSAVGTSTNSTAAGRFSFTDWALGATNGSDVFVGVINTTEYYQVTLTPTAGYALDLNTITFTIQRSGTGIRQYVVRSSLDSYANNLPASISPANANLSVEATNIFQIVDATTAANNGSTITLDSSYDAITTPITFRFYGFNAEANTGTFSIDNVAFNGEMVFACTPPLTPSGVISGTTPACGNTSLNFSGTAPANVIYYWQTAASGTSMVNNANAALSVSTSGNYYVRAYNTVDACWSTGSVGPYAVVVNAIPSEPTTANPAATCQGTAVVITGEGGGASTYTFWDSPSGGFQYTTGGNFTYNSPNLTVGTGVTSGTYNFYIQGQNGTCLSPTRRMVTLVINPLPATPTGTITVSANPACGSATLSYPAGFYWQTTATGTSTAFPTSSNYILNTTGTVYVRALSGSCWSSALASPAVTVHTPITITTQPVLENINIPGGPRNFSVVADGTGLSYQWQIDTGSGFSNLVNGAPYSNVTTATMSVNPSTLAMNGHYFRCVVSGTAPCTAVTSDAGRLKVFPNNATALTPCIGNTEVGLSWTASTSVGTVGYMVFALAGATAPSLTPASAGDATSYTANTNYTLATTYGTLGRLVYKGTDINTNITGLTLGQQYTFKVVAYNMETYTGWANGINTLGSWNQTLTTGVPNVNITGASTAPNSCAITWTNPLPTSCYETLIVANQGGPVVFTPTGDGSAYTANATYSGPNQVVFKGVGTATTVLGLTQDVEYCYTVFVRRGTQWSTGVSICRTTGAVYCASNVSPGIDDNTGITQVQFNTINQSSSGNPSYTDFTAVSTTVLINQTYNLTVNVDTDGFQTYTKAWIDWNRDGDFNDSGEEYDLGDTYGAATLASNSPLSIYVPANAVPGNTRMRIATQYFFDDSDVILAPCGTYNYSEVEDYTINIQRPPGAEINVISNNITILSGFDAPFSLNNTLYGATNLGATNGPRTFTIQNLGLSALNLTGVPLVSVVGDHPGDFTVTQPSANTIASATSLDFTITFEPQVGGIRNAIISIANNDSTGSENPYTFAVRGTGVCNTPILSTITPTTGPVGTEVTLTATQNNYSGAVVRYNGVLLTTTQVSATQIKVTVPAGAVSGNFSITNSTGCTIEVPFTIIDNVIQGCAGNTADVRTELFISEVTDHGSGSHTYIELYNPRTTSINLSGYTVRTHNNGATTATSTINLTGSIAANSTYLIAIGGGDAGSNFGGHTPNLISAATSGINNNDHIRLYNGAVWQDLWGNTANVVFTIADKDYTYRRLNEGIIAPSITWNPSDWTAITPVDYTNIGQYANTAGIPPIVDQQPTFEPTCKTVVLEVEASEGVVDATGILYQWFVAIPGQSGWSVLSNGGVYSGATTNVLTISDITGLDGYQYYCQVRENNVTCYVASEAVVIREPQTIIWDGVDWTSSITPSFNTNVIFDADYDTSVHGDVTACACQINTGRVVTIASGGYLDIFDGVNNQGTLNIDDTGSLKQHNDDAVNFGNIKMTRTTRNMYRWDYVYWGSPVEENIIAQIPNPQFDKKYKWVPGVGANWFVLDAVIPGQGFITRVRNQFPFNDIAQVNRSISFDFTGKPNNGLVNATMTRVDADALNFSNYNLLANPYPSAIDAELFLTQNSGAIDGTIYYWTSITPYPGIGNYQTGDYAKWNLTGGVGTNAANDSPSNTALRPDGQIVAGQGFFVQALVNNATVTFRNAQRLITDNTQFFRMAQPQTTQSVSGSKHRFWLNLTSENGHFNQMLIGYLPGATNDIDWGYDGFSVVNNPVNIYSHVNGKSLSIQGRALPFDQNDIVPLGLRITTAGTYKIALDEVDGLFSDNQIIYLEDLSTGAVHNLKQSPYSFTSAAGTFESRFQIRYTNETLGIDEVTVPSNTVWVYGTDVMTAVSSEELLANVVVHDLLGRRLYEAKNISAMQHVIGLKPAEQVLLVTITLANGQVETRKVKF
ncbi:MAG: GEVED domain-containing protein [Flavobacterium sp.]|nr:GEVED domain-containing protein [Flavobacterium sp.]